MRLFFMKQNFWKHTRILNEYYSILHGFHATNVWVDVTLWNAGRFVHSLSLQHITIRQFPRISADIYKAKYCMATLSKQAMMPSCASRCSWISSSCFHYRILILIFERWFAAVDIIGDRSFIFMSLSLFLHWKMSLRIPIVSTWSHEVWL